jgi:hypothetical protein
MSSNKFHYGNLTITGSLMAQSITGSLQGTASYALNSPPSISSSYALTASYVEGTIASASYALTASYALNGGTTIDTGSLVTTSSFNNFTSSYSTGSFTGSFIGDGSGLIGVVSSSYAATSSIALSSSYSLSSSYAASASLATTSLNTSDILIYVKNTTGATIEKGKVVKISGATGDNALISTASYNSEGSSANTLGILNETIADQAFGYVMTEGKLLGIDTSPFTAGQLLYLGPTGSIVSSPPLAPLHTVRLGQALRIQSINGSMYVRIDNGYELDELHNVLIISGSDGDLIVASGSNGNGGRLYVNTKQLTGSYGLTGSLSVLSGSIISNLVGTASWADNSNTASYVQNAQSASYYVETDPIFVAKSGSLATTGSNTFVGDQIVQGNLNVVGTASFVYTTSSIINIGSSIINLNTNNPATRFGGITVIDSGSFGTSSTGSLFWDSQNNRWIYANPSGSTYDGGMFISGPRNTSGIGNEVGVTNNFLVVGNGADHISSSMIFHSASITQITGSLEVISGITGSLLGTASTASYVENAQTASYVINAISASYVNLSQTASYVVSSISASLSQTASYVSLAKSASYVQTAQTASYVVNAISASYINLAQTASYYAETDPLFVSKSGSLATTGSNIFTNNQTVTGSLSVKGTGATYSLILDTDTLSDTQSTRLFFKSSLPTNDISIRNASGSLLFGTRGVAGSASGTTSLFISGSGNIGIGNVAPTLGLLQVGGNVYATSFTGSLQGTATNAQTASYVDTAQTASYVVNAISASYIQTAQTSSYYAETDPLFVSKSGSLATTGSNTFNGNQTITGSLIVVDGGVKGITLGMDTSVDNSQRSSRLLFSQQDPTKSTSIFAISGSMLFSTSASYNSTSGLTRMFISESGDVGIGTSTPTLAKLQVNGNVYATSFTGSGLQITGSTSVDLVRITQTGAGNAFIVEDSTSPDVSPFVINNVGSVGIGTSTPSRLLSVNGVFGVQYNDATESFAVNPTSTGTDFIIKNGSNPTLGEFRVDTRTGQRFAYYNGGNFAIGSQADDGVNKLQVNGNTIITGSLNVTAGITGSLLGTASTASYVILAQTASSADNLRVRGTLNADGVQFIRQYGGTSTNWFSSSLAIGKGGTANATLDVTGSAIITGSLIVTTGITGSLLGTASTASYVENAQTASYYNGLIISSSYATTSSYSQLAATASYFSGSISDAVNATSASYALTASYVANSISSSYALTASYIEGGASSTPPYGIINAMIIGNIFM